MAIETVTYCLPAHWASAFFNGDTSGMEDDDEAQFNAVVEGENLGTPLSIENDHPEFGPESFFCKYHDAINYGVLASDCFDYVFPV